MSIIKGFAGDLGISSRCRIFFIFIIVGLLWYQCEQRLPEFEELPRQFELPDPFIMMDGTQIKTKEDWYNKRRPELKKLFQHYIYGYLPQKPQMNARVIKEDPNLFHGKATYKEITLELLLPYSKTHIINVALFVPNNRKSPVPVFIAANSCGNHTLVDYNNITVIEQSWIHQSCQKRYLRRGSRSEKWEVENTIEHGYALASFAVSDLDPDKNDWTDGIHSDYTNPPGDKNTRWGTLAAWAWGILRLVDYLETDSDIDTNRICVTGWSRRGKSALFAAAMDERIDLVVPHMSGTGGMALSRMNPSESVARINKKFPHWFNDNFVKFGQDVERLPVDQHLLIALVAPRPLLDNEGMKDSWASPHLALEAMKAASPVYELLGVKGIIGDGVVCDTIGNVKMGRLLQYQRDTGHTLNINYWNAMFDFADRQLTLSRSE